MSISQTQIKGTVVLNSDAGSTLTIGNSTATNSITGATNINTAGTANTSIGVAGSTTTIAGTTNINTSGTATATIGIQSSTINMRGGVSINTNGTGGFSNTTIGTPGSVTAINGTTDINISGGSGTTIGTVASGTSTIRGATVNVSGSTNTITGTTNINATGGANTTIGTANTGTTTIKGLSINIGDNSPVNINNATATTNLRNTTIGNTTGAFNTNTALNGITTISKPTIGQPISFSGFTAPIAGQMFYNNKTFTPVFYTGSTTLKAYAPVNNLTQGVYLLLGFVYLGEASVSTKVTTTLVFSNAPIVNEQSTNITGIFDNTLEAYGYKATTGAIGGNWTLNLSTIYTVQASPNNNIAVGVQCGVTVPTADLYIDIKYCRLA